ncbi:GNAT family N-acetyltransferase [Winogradskyella schleiferi]|uniref:GNAT family N-acetyltransferase n=1 Tax=Winogradskyella schleiferi TaxID=2686078 RepID=UPI0015BAA657|nr:GNAT family N-acetyltransferase [Winogradskyella schleiferi]
MKICIAQTKSLKGKVQHNIHNHLQLIERSIPFHSDLVIFPELSITGYEPDLAKELATTFENDMFNPFQEVSDKNDITIGIGMPTNGTEGTFISMLIFQPRTQRTVYSKQLLHADEKPYFVCGTHQTYLHIKDKKIALGICCETLQQEHILNSNKNGADLYIASVAKSKAGVDKAYSHFSKMANEFNTPILMSNCIGICDNFLSVGQSAVWNNKGDLLEKLDDESQGLLIYDTELETVEIHQLKIAKGQLSDLEAVFQMYLNAKDELENNGIYQWTANYPTHAIIENDLKNGTLFTLKNSNELIGAISISEEQEKEYQSVNWKFNASKVLVIHRLVVNPKHQNKGHARTLMDFAENLAKENNYTSIRLDAYSRNTSVLKFYKKRNYIIRGEVNFPEREHVFYCMENELIELKPKKQ